MGLWVPYAIAYTISCQVSLSDVLRFVNLAVGFARRFSCLVKSHANWLSLLGIVLLSLALFLVAVFRESDMYTRLTSLLGLHLVMMLSCRRRFMEVLAVSLSWRTGSLDTR